MEDCKAVASILEEGNKAKNKETQRPCSALKLRNQRNSQRERNNSQPSLVLLKEIPLLKPILAHFEWVDMEESKQKTLYPMKRDLLATHWSLELPNGGEKASKRVSPSNERLFAKRFTPKAPPPPTKLKSELLRSHWALGEGSQAPSPATKPKGRTRDKLTLRQEAWEFARKLEQRKRDKGLRTRVHDVYESHWRLSDGNDGRKSPKQRPSTATGRPPVRLTLKEEASRFEPRYIPPAQRKADLYRSHWNLASAAESSSIRAKSQSRPRPATARPNLSAGVRSEVKPHRFQFLTSQITLG